MDININFKLNNDELSNYDSASKFLINKIVGDSNKYSNKIKINTINNNTSNLNYDNKYIPKLFNNKNIIRSLLKYININSNYNINLEIFNELKGYTVSLNNLNYLKNKLIYLSQPFTDKQVYYLTNIYKEIIEISKENDNSDACDIMLILEYYLNINVNYLKYIKY